MMERSRELEAMRRMDRHASRRSERGHAIIEGVLVILPMLALMFGIIDVSFVVFLQGTFQHATREAARWAITYQTTYNSPSGSVDCSGSQTNCIIQVAKDNSGGFLNGTNYVVVNYYAPDDLTNPLTTANPSHILPSGKPLSYINQPGNIVEVRVNNFRWSWFMPIPLLGSSSSPLGTSILLNAASADVLGGLAAGALAPPTP